MRVLVTGASGHVGSAVAERLCDRGHTVVGLSRQPARARGLTELLRVDLRAHDAIDFVRKHCSPCQILVHAAAAIHKDFGNLDLITTNCLGSQQVFTLAKAWGCSHVIFLSSIGVIGTPRKTPITEDHPVCPQSTYHASKLFGEHLVHLLRRDNICSIALRLTSPVGLGMAGNRILSTFIRRSLAGDPVQIMGQGTRRQNYVDVRDVARGVEACLACNKSGVFNMPGRETIANIDLARKCVALLGSSSPIEFAGTQDPEEGINWEVDFAKAGRELGYVPQVTLEESILDLSLELKEAFVQGCPKGS